jgi:hypothetical protein
MHEHHPKTQVSVLQLLKAAPNKLAARRHESLFHITNDLIDKKLEDDVYF